MEVNLAPELEEYLRSQVENGRYISVDQATEAAVETLMLQEGWEEDLARFKPEIDEGLADIAAGRCSALTLEELKAKAREKFRILA